MTTQLPPAEITLDDLLAGMWRQWLLMAVCIVTVTAAAAAAAFVMTPKYRAEAVVIPVKADDTRGLLSGAIGSLGGLASLAGLGGASGSNKDEYIAYLQSRSFAARFITDENLLPALFYKRWDAKASRWNVTDPEDVPTLADGVKFLDEHVRSVQEERRTGIVTLSVIWTSPELAARWANLMIERANRDLRQRAVAEAEASTAYLNSELAKTNVVELRAAIYRLIENQIKSAMMANTREQYAFKIIDAASPPDKKDMVRPKRAAMIGFGVLFGTIVGMAIVAVRLRRGQRPR